MAKNWVAYGYTGVSLPDNVISIGRNNFFIIAAALAERLGASIALSFEPEMRLIGFERANGTTRRPLKLFRIASSENGAYAVRAQGFFRAFGIDCDKVKGRYNIEEDNGIIFIRLREEGNDTP